MQKTRNNGIIETLSALEKQLAKVVCKRCNTLTDIDQLSKKQSSIICEVCESMICRFCKELFKKNEFGNCSNEKCPMNHSDVYEQLKVFENKRFPFKFDDGTVGKIDFARVCPKCEDCLILRKNTDDCKHCKCWGCHQNFCHVCLGLGDEKENFKCGGAWDFCKRAPFQTQKKK